MTKRTRTRSEPVDRGTPETRARLREGTIARLVKTGKMGVEHQSAALDIEYVWRIVCAAVLPKTSGYNERVDGSESDWSASMQQAYRKRYKPWADHLSALRDNGGPPYLEITIDIVCDSMTARAVDRKNGWKSGTAQDLLIFALQEYCYIAGWLKRPIPFHTPERKSA